MENNDQESQQKLFEYQRRLYDYIKEIQQYYLEYMNSCAKTLANWAFVFNAGGLAALATASSGGVIKMTEWVSLSVTLFIFGLLFALLAYSREYFRFSDLNNKAIKLFKETDNEEYLENPGKFSEELKKADRGSNFIMIFQSASYALFFLGILFAAVGISGKVSLLWWTIPVGGVLIVIFRASIIHWRFCQFISSIVKKDGCKEFFGFK